MGTSSSGNKNVVYVKISDAPSGYKVNKDDYFKAATTNRVNWTSVIKLKSSGLTSCSIAVIIIVIVVVVIIIVVIVLLVCMGGSESEETESEESDASKGEDEESEEGEEEEEQADQPAE